MDRDKFFSFLEKNNNVQLNPKNTLGFVYILSQCDLYRPGLQEFAYILATAYWETAFTMQPVREAFWKDENWRKENLRYYPYYGRGYVQLTWQSNYKRATEYFTKELGQHVDFVNYPDEALLAENAIIIMFVGMDQGWFTNRPLKRYIDNEIESENEDFREFTLARQVINGTDRAEKIANIALAMQGALLSAGYRY